jgi:hypothetical protein
MKERTARSGGLLGLIRRLGWIKLALLGVLALALAYGVRRWRRYEPHIDVPLAADFRLGYNLDFPGDWTNLPPFIDQVKNARGFEGGCGEGEPECHPTRHLDLDAQGWLKSMRFRDDPTRSYQRVELIFNSSKERHDIGKPFAVTWRGQGELEVRGPNDAQYDAEQRRITFTLPAGLSLLRITANDPARTGEYLRDIRIFRAEYEALLAEGKVFDPDMLRFLAPFRSLRFMDWMQTNSAGRCSGGDHDGKDCYAVSNESCGSGGVCVMAGKWSERPSADQAIWIHTGQFLDNAAPERGTKLGGYPLEILVALANELRAAPHFNLPADADEEYTREFASYLKRHLEPSLPASIEYSNEVWNWKFPQADYAKARAAKLWPGVGTGWVQYGAVRTHQMCRVFREVFAGQEWRVRCLISPQTGWRGLAPEVLDCPSWTAEHPEDQSCTKYVDAINIAGYFGGCMPSQSEVIAGWLREGREAALTKAFEHLEQGGGMEACSEDEDDSVANAIDNYRHYMQLAARRGLGLEVYEGGTHFEYSADSEGGSEEVAQFFVDVARDPRMREAYLRNYEGFRAAGGSTFNVWGWIAPNDAWANVDSPVDLTHPKYRAIVELAERVAPRRAP